MSRRNEFEEASELSFNPNNSLLRHLCFCKKIAPREGDIWIGGHLYDKGFPRIVKSNFKTPPNWKEIERVEAGQVLERTTYRRNFGEELVHTCIKPYDICVEGFWAKRAQLPPRGE